MLRPPLIKQKPWRYNFSLSLPDVNLSDLSNALYPAETPSPMSISEEEISSVIKKLHPFKAAGSDGYPFFILKYLGSPLVTFLKHLFQACIDLFYHSNAFFHSTTVSLRKPGKWDY